MQELIINNRAEIEQEFRQLGFSNAAAILDTAVPMYNTQGSAPAGIYMDDLSVSDGSPSNELGFVFNFRQKDNNATWQLESARFAVDVPTDRLVEGFKPFTRAWYIADGPLPHKERMRWETNRAAKIETEKEFFLFNPQAKSPMSVDPTSVMPSMDNQLEAELKRLGLPHHPQMLATATFRDNLAFLNTRGKIDPGRFPDADAMDFFYAVVYPENKIPLRIEYLNATLVRDGPGDKELRILTERDYWLANGPMPTKDQIVRDIQRKLEPKLGTVRKAPLVAAANKSPSSGFRPRH